MEMDIKDHLEKQRVPNNQKPKAQNNQPTMVSSRAAEYITRFSKGVNNKVALEKIVEYREECKKMYAEVEAGRSGMKFKNFPAQRSYLEDMIERIKALAEARDNLQATANKTKDNAKSAMPFAEYMETKTTKTETKKAHKKNSAEYFFARTKRGLQMRGIKNEHELKYILRFQDSGITGSTNGCAEYPLIDVNEYLNGQVEMKEGLSSDDHEGHKFHQERIDALYKVTKYFEDINETIMSLTIPGYISRSDDDDDDITRFGGDH
jgi:hypothetical protein